jgi:HTH-type transcriptional regulator/antitoxin HigA
MTHTDTFEPKWINPPGSTVIDLLRERKMPVGELAHAIHKDANAVSRLLYGIEPLTTDWAESLAKVVGASAAFWIRREEQYRADLSRLCQVSATDVGGEWIRSLPVKDMVRFGWIEQGSTSRETHLNACAFLGVTTAESFQRRYRDPLAGSAYRASKAFETLPPAVAAWLRKGEIEASGIDCSPWSATKLRAELRDIRSLSREKDPAVFLPKLEAMLSSCGVAMVIARAPEGCRASGVTRFLSPIKALIQLSFRYLSDDQFWFTLFHELGHVLLHGQDRLFLEMDDDEQSAAEQEADAFALETLFENVGVSALHDASLTDLGIARLARKADIAPGIVVGQLQALHRVPYNHFNYLKLRYKW